MQTKKAYQNLSARQYVEFLAEQIKSSKGTRGISRMREVYEKCKNHLWDYERRMYGGGYTKRVHITYQIPVKWAHRHGISQSIHMVRMAEKAQKALNTKPVYTRGEYNQILCPSARSLSEDAMNDHLYYRWTSSYQAALKCIKAIELQGFDEHGGWIEMSDFDGKGVGIAINVDVYGIDNVNNLFVVQVRRYDKASKNGYGNVRKNYFLIGYNENGNPFAHSIPSAIVHAAIRKDPSIESPVNAAQAWIWDIKPEQLPEVLRNGDVALIPAKPAEIKKATVREEKRARVIDSHWLFGKEIRVNGHLFALNPTLRHYKGQHPTQKGKGWYRVAVAKRAKFWDFARPTVD